MHDLASTLDASLSSLLAWVVSGLYGFIWVYMHVVTSGGTGFGVWCPLISSLVSLFKLLDPQMTTMAKECVCNTTIIIYSYIQLTISNPLST
jgi:hypothetical protein